MQIRKKRKKLLLITLAVFLILLTGIISAFVKRDSLLEAAVKKAIAKAQSKYNLNVKIDSYEFSGLTTVHFNNISVIPEGKDSLSSIQSATVGIKLFPLLFGNIKIALFEMDKGNISLVKKDSTSNYDFLFRKDSVRNENNQTESDFAHLANRLIHQVLDKIPDEMNIKDFGITYKNDTSLISIYTQTASIRDKKVNSNIIINGNKSVWHIGGTADPAREKLHLKLYADHEKVELPFVEQKYGLKVTFDTVTTELISAKKRKKDFEIEGNWSVKNLFINHPKISMDDVIVPDAAVYAKLIIGKSFLSVDSSSVVSIGNASFSPFIKIGMSPQKTIALKLRAPEQKAQDIFDAFPIGLFESLEGIKVQGNLKYDFDFYFDTSDPDSVLLNSELTASNDFRIVSYGKTNLEKINGAFIYTPYEKGKPVRDILVAEQNPNYTRLSDISPNLKNAVITAEDPTFFSHNGFVEEAFKQSISTNFKTKSFKRGGSTISMQLVKNIFLNRNKTVARKVEEMLIVWLIESQKLSSKSRILEVYLNIIEWGRNIYGIKEAAYYYFGKHPAELSVGESIYLANIIPKPKSSLYAWQADGSLKPYLQRYFNWVGKLMAISGYTTRDSSSYGYFEVRLRESLRQQIAPTDSIPDSLDEDSGEDLFKFFKPKTDSSEVNKTNSLKKLFVPKEDSSAKKNIIETRKERRQRKREEQNSSL